MFKGITKDTPQARISHQGNSKAAPQARKCLVSHRVYAFKLVKVFEGALSNAFQDFCTPEDTTNYYSLLRCLLEHLVVCGFCVHGGL
ncbi:hypothetical protein KDA23_02360 [Candidatus Saccharibacteria bacterium]|nr:hypothetical protein [Candidatus Saccharibacteria bacterium]